MSSETPQAQATTEKPTQNTSEGRKTSLLEAAQKDKLATLLDTLGYPADEVDDPKIQTAYRKIVTDNARHEERGASPLDETIFLQSALNYQDLYGNLDGRAMPNVTDEAPPEGDARVNSYTQFAAEQRTEARKTRLRAQLESLGFGDDVVENRLARDMYEQIEHQNKLRQVRGKEPRDMKKALVAEMKMRGAEITLPKTE